MKTPRFRLRNWIDQQTDLTLPQGGTNPYLDGRREWNERYGSYIARAATWRWVALAELFVIAMLAWSLQSIARQAHVQPFIVQVDKLGEAVAVKKADPGEIPDERIIRFQLASMIVDAKSITPDPIVQKRWLDNVYAIVGGDAKNYLDGWYKSHNPFAKPRPDPLVVTIRSVLPLSRMSWEIQWQEAAKPGNGTPDITTYWRAVVTLKFFTATTTAQITANPSGVIIDTINWTQQL